MSPTRTPACTVRGCPWPNDYPHTPWCLHIQNVLHQPTAPTHQHWPKKGMGGNNPDSKIVAILCSFCHDAVDNGYKWGNGVFPDGEGKRHYLLWDVAKGIENPLIDRTLEAGSAAAERVATRVGSAQDVSSAAAPSASGGSGAAEASELGKFSLPSKDTLSPSPRPSAAPPSLESWCREGMELVYMALRLQRMSTELAFEIGDWANAGENTLGEAAHQFFGVFSYWQIATWASVARRVPALGRHKELPFGHHQAVAMLPEPEQRKKLDEAAQAKWPLKTLREAVDGSPGSRPKVRRYTSAELDFLCPTCRAVLEAL